MTAPGAKIRLERRLGGDLLGGSFRRCRLSAGHASLLGARRVAALGAHAGSVAASRQCTILTVGTTAWATATPVVPRTMEVAWRWLIGGWRRLLVRHFDPP